MLRKSPVPNALVASKHSVSLEHFKINKIDGILLQN